MDTQIDWPNAKVLSCWGKLSGFFANLILSQLSFNFIKIHVYCPLNTVNKTSSVKKRKNA